LAIGTAPNNIANDIIDTTIVCIIKDAVMTEYFSDCEVELAINVIIGFLINPLRVNSMTVVMVMNRAHVPFSSSVIILNIKITFRNP
jgi:hypothetical protein